MRYLEQGNVSLVMEALKERGLLRQNAPHLVSELPFIVPELLVVGRARSTASASSSTRCSPANTASARRSFSPRRKRCKRLPSVNPDGLTGGVVYYDGQFDDTRLLINLVATAAEQGATLLNYAKVTAPAQGRRRHRQRRDLAGRRDRARRFERAGQGRRQRHRRRSPIPCASWPIPTRKR